MLNSLINIFKENNDDKIEDDNYYLRLLCGLMIEAANLDDKITEDEIKKIENILVYSFKEDPKEVVKEINEAIQNKNNSKSLHFYTSKFNKEYDHSMKILLIEKMWEIILSDNNLHDYEANLIRRLAGLLYISDVESGNAKQRALNNLKMI